MCTKQLLISAVFLLYAQHISTVHILHLSFHRGCINEINFIAQELRFDVTSLFIPDMLPLEFDGYASGNALYNISHERALNIWNKHKNYFNQFDAIITSDTAPLARIFLQNNYEKPLIIWICNRFDYTDTTSLDSDFPDEEYYQLLREAQHKKNVLTVAYTAFESFYAAQKNVIFNHDTLQPSGIFSGDNNLSDIPAYSDTSQTFFIPPYLNDAAMNLAQQCSSLGIATYTGKYNGSHSLKKFKGIIHIPYAWSNFAFFENMQNELPYFIPSITFMLKNFDTGIIWWQNSNYFKENYHLAEWYNEENREIITYFDSWDDLKQKIESTDFDALRTKIQQFAQIHRNKMLRQWGDIVHNFIEN
jgi:hypothetical protein